MHTEILPQSSFALLRGELIKGGRLFFAQKGLVIVLIALVVLVRSSAQFGLVVHSLFSNSGFPVNKTRAKRENTEIDGHVHD